MILRADENHHLSALIMNQLKCWLGEALGDYLVLMHQGIQLQLDLVPS